MKKRLFVVVFLLILCLGILLFASCGTVKKSVAKTGTNMSLKLDHAHHLVISSADGELIEVTDAGIVQAISDIFASVVFVDGPSMKDQDGSWPSLSWYDTANGMIVFLFFVDEENIIYNEIWWRVADSSYKIDVDRINALTGAKLEKNRNYFS